VELDVSDKNKSFFVSEISIYSCWFRSSWCLFTWLETKISILDFKYMSYSLEKRELEVMMELSDEIPFNMESGCEHVFKLLS